MNLRAAARLGGALLSIACLLYFGVAMHKVFSAESFSFGQSRVLDRLPLATGLFMLAYAALAGTWYCLLRMFRLKVSPVRVFGIYLTTQVAKYLPGSVGHHVGRVFLTTRDGLSGFRVGLSIAVELLLNIPIALLLSLPLAPVLMTRLDAGATHRNPLLLSALAVGVIAATTLYLLRHHPALRSAGAHLRTALREARGLHAVPLFVCAFFLSMLGLILAGLSLVSLCVDVPALGFATAAHGVALVCVAWIVGSVTPGAPAGLGVRDAILLAGLGTLFDHQTAVEATLVFRGLSVVVDLLALVCGLGLMRRSSVPGALA